jgi:MFS family permease
MFARHETAISRHGAEPLVDLALLGLPRMRAGLIVQACQAFIIQASFFVLPLYLQTVLGFDALETGKTILPLSLALFVFALGGAALAGRYAPKRIVETGLIALLLGEVVILLFIAPDLQSFGFGVGMALLGTGLGLMASQVGNVIMSSVEPSRGGEAGGLQGTSLNLGASMGVALVGSIVIAMLSTGFTNGVMSSTTLPDQVKTQVATSAESSANFVTTTQVETAATEAGLPQEQVAEVVSHYTEAQLQSLRAGFAFLALFALLALAWVRRLPRAPSEVIQPQPEASSA